MSYCHHLCSTALHCLFELGHLYMVCALVYQLSKYNKDFNNNLFDFLAKAIPKPGRDHKTVVFDVLLKGKVKPCTASCMYVCVWMCV